MGITFEASGRTMPRVTPITMLSVVSPYEL